MLSCPGIMRDDFERRPSWETCSDWKRKCAQREHDVLEAIDFDTLGIEREVVLAKFPWGIPYDKLCNCHDRAEKAGVYESANGNCGNDKNYIETRSDCEAAARALGLDDQVANDASNPAFCRGVCTDLPKGCYYKGSNHEDYRLWYNPRGTKQNKGTTRTSICKKQPTATASRYTATPGMYCQFDLPAEPSYYKQKTLAECETICDERADCALYLWRTAGGTCHIRRGDKSCKPHATAGYTLYKKKVTPLGGTNDGNAKNLQACIGECDSDDQCREGLKCFQRSGFTPVPGCSGQGKKDWDYCYDPSGSAVLSGGNDGRAKNLKACTGECDSDAQCAPGLKCFQRDNGETIPGCVGDGAGKDWDYCYNPNWTTSTTLCYPHRREACMQADKCEWVRRGAKSFCNRKDAPTLRQLSPSGYCSDWRFPSTGTRSGGYDNLSISYLQCFERCQEKFPGTVTFYMKGNQCGCSTTTNGPCKVVKHRAYKAYVVANSGRRLGVAEASFEEMDAEAPFSDDVEEIDEEETFEP